MIATNDIGRKESVKLYLSLKQQFFVYCYYMRPVKQNISAKFVIISNLSVETCVFDAQKSRLIETVLLSTNNIGFR